MAPTDEIPVMTEDEYDKLMATSAAPAVPDLMTEDQYNALMKYPEALDPNSTFSLADPSPGWLPTSWIALTKGVGDTTEGLGGAIKWLEDRTTGTSLGQSIIDDEKPRNALRAMYLNKVAEDTPQWYANRVAEGVFPLISAIALRRPTTAAAGMGTVGFGQQYQRALDEGASPEDATNSALLSGGAAALTSLPVFEAAQASGPLLNRALTSATVGAASSVPNTIGQYYANQIATGESADPATLMTPLRQNATVAAMMGGLAPFGFAAAEKLRSRNVDAEALGASLRDRLLSREQPFDTEGAIVNEPPKPPELLSETAGPNRPPREPLALPLQTGKATEPATSPSADSIPAGPRAPEPNPVVTVSESVKAPDAETSSFPDPLKDAQTALVVQENKARPEEPPPISEGTLAKQSSYDALEAKAKELEIEPLDYAQSWFQGQVGGKDVPLVSRVLSAFRTHITMPRSISIKFPEAQNLYKAGRTEVEKEAMVASGMTELLRPFFKADNPELVNAYIGQLGEITKQFQRERSAATKRLREQMQKASDLVGSQQVRISGDPEAIKAYATEIATKAQAELSAIEARPIPKATPEDMQALGLTQNDITAVMAHREAMNYGAERLREVLQLQGRKIKDPETAKQYSDDVNKYIDGLLNTNYFPAIRYGQSWAATAKDKDGNTIWRVDVDSLGQAKKEVKAFRAKNREATVKIIEKPRLDADAFPDMPSNLADAIQAFDSRKWTENAKRRPPLGFTKHLIEAQKIPGYYGDIRRSTIDYALGLSKYYGRQHAKAVLDDIVSSLPAGSALRGYAQRYSDRLIKPEAAPVKSLLKFSNFMKLAGVPTSALINTTQTITTTIPKLEGELIKSYGAIGAARETPKVFAKVTAQAFAYLADRSGAKFVKGLNRKVAPELFLHLDEAGKAGIFDSEGLRELYNWKQKVQSRPTMADSLMFMFSAAEQANRLIAFLAGREAGIARGLKGNALLDYSKGFVTTTQFDQTVANRPPVMSHGLARVATQYRPFQLNYLRFLRENFNSKDFPVVGLSLAAMLGLGGAFAVPFARDAERISESLGFSPLRAFRKMMGNERWADAALYGLPMDQGVSISGAVSPGEFMMSDLGPRSVAKLLGPTADFAFNQLPKAYEALKEQENPLIAAEIAGPRFLRGPLKVLRANSEGGTLRNYQDAPLLKQMSNQEKLALSVGATPSRLQKEMELDSEFYKLLNRAKSKPKDYNSLIARALREGDRTRIRELGQEIRAWNQANKQAQQISPHLPTIINEIIAGKRRELGQFRKLPEKARAEYLDILRESGKLPSKSSLKD